MLNHKSKNAFTRATGWSGYNDPNFWHNVPIRDENRKPIRNESGAIVTVGSLQLERNAFDLPDGGWSNFSSSRPRQSVIESSDPPVIESPKQVEKHQFDDTESLQVFEARENAEVDVAKNNNDYAERSSDIPENVLDVASDKSDRVTALQRDTMAQIRVKLDQLKRLAEDSHADYTETIVKSADIRIAAIKVLRAKQITQSGRFYSAMLETLCEVQAHL